MEILLINTYDRGGAAKACLRLHNGLIKSDIHSSVLVLKKINPGLKVFAFEIQNNVSSLQINNSIRKRLKRKIKRILFELHIVKPKPVIDYQKQLRDNFFAQRNKTLEMFSFPDSKFNIVENKYFKCSDVIHLHWVANFVDYKSFFENCTKPVIWTLHDMNPFTGGEHYTEEYIDIDSDGFPVKRILSENEKSTFETILKLKSESLKNFNNLHIVVLNNWMADQVKRSDILNRYPLSIIPNGIDTSVFKPRDKDFSRDLLGLPNNKIVLLFVADSVDNFRKGYRFLQLALAKINKSNIVLCAVGHKSDELQQTESLVEFGEVKDERFMSVIYSAADVFIAPAIMDNLPNTVIESLLCGTPVVGFPVGGMTDLIQHGVNGYLADNVSVDSLLSTIQHFFETMHMFNKNEIVENAREKYDADIMATKYIDLYKRSMIKKK